MRVVCGCGATLTNWRDCLCHFKASFDKKYPTGMTFWKATKLFFSISIVTEKAYRERA